MIVEWIAVHRVDSLTPLIFTVSLFGSIGAGLIGGLVWYALKEDVEFLTGIIFVTGLTIFLKILIRQPRPDSAIYETAIPYAFPSTHAAIAFFMAAMIAKDSRYGIYAYIGATLIAFSRLYLGVHTTADVVAGIIIGTAIYIMIKW